MPLGASYSFALDIVGFEARSPIKETLLSTKSKEVFSYLTSDSIFDSPSAEQAAFFVRCGFGRDKPITRFGYRFFKLYGVRGLLGHKSRLAAGT